MKAPQFNSTSHVSAVPPNLGDYAIARANFSWDGVLRELDGLPGDKGLNIAHEAVDRHSRGALRDHVAIRWLGKNGAIRDISYGELSARSSRFANVLRGLGVGKGERVFSLADRIPELYFAALGTLKNTSVFCPLFPAFGPGPIHQRCRGEMPERSSPPPRSIKQRSPACGPNCRS